MEELLQKELKVFLTVYSPGTSLSNIDDIVLNYLSEIISSLSQDSEIDVTPFTDMITAYIPEFGAIDSKAVSEWVHTLVSMFSVSSYPHKQEKTTPQQAATPITPPLTLSSHPEAASSQLPRKPVLDSRVDKESDAEGAEDINTEAGQVRSDQVALVADIFPGVSHDTIRKTLHCCQGNIDKCVQVLLDSTERNHTQQWLPQWKQEEMCAVQPPDCEKLKAFITARYSLVDTRDDSITHRPVEPKWEGKKMVRYRDNHVVSTKGERYLVETTKSEGNEGSTKASYIRPLRKYRFH